MFVTEGGARLSRMPDLYPAEEPREAQASACATRGRCMRARTAPGPAWRCSPSTCSTPTPTSTAGLLDPFPSTVKRPAYEAWKAFPAYS